MFIDKKYITIRKSKDSAYDMTPLMYIDGYKRTASLKRHWRDNSAIYFLIGFSSLHLHIEFKWNFIEREKTDEEIKECDRLNKIFGDK